MLWEELLKFLTNNVPAGTVTTYGNLAEVFFGGPGSGSAIGAMLKAAVRADPANCIWTNRVVGTQGKINADGQLEQLQKEGIPIRQNGNVDIKQCPPLGFREPEPRRPPRRPPPQRPTADATTAFDVFQDIVNDQNNQDTEDLQMILQSTPYERGSFANLIKYHLGERLGKYLNQPNADLFTLIRRAEDAKLMKDNAIDLAHIIRKQRNQIIYNNVPVESYHARNRLVVIAAYLLWPQLPG